MCAGAFPASAAVDDAAAGHAGAQGGEQVWGHEMRCSASLIISTWNGRHLLETCLPRVLRAVEQDGGEHEVIVVDDASTDGTAEYVRREFPRVRLIALPRNLRFAGANDAAARAARGEALVFLNNDMLVEPDFLGPLLRHFRDPAVFAVTAHIQMAPHLVGGGLVRESGLVRARFENGAFVLRHEDPDSGEAVPVMYAGGGSSAWRRDRFFQLGAFDLMFRPFYFEDLDLSYRAQKAGWRVLFEPGSRLTHQHRQTNAPHNFPGGYVDLMFCKNELLFTWKVLTDPDLINRHFRALWGRLMRPRQHPRLGACFLRAAAQLPELLVKRQRARRDLLLTDKAVLERGGSPSLEAADAGELPYGSTGAGRRILVIGFSPLPCEWELRLSALGFRTWHLAQALLADGHRVTLVGVRTAAAYRDQARRPAVLRFRGQHFTYYSAEHSVMEAGDLLQRICDQERPDAMVAVHTYGAWLATRLGTEAPLWADLNSYAMAEAQARAALEGSDAAMAEAWQRERAVLARADAFSVVSMRQKYAIIGELFAVGRLASANYGEDRVHYLPNAIENLPYRHREGVLRGGLVAEDDFVVLWAGGYNTWTDVDTLFDGLTAAMREEPRVTFVSLGGALPGRDENTFYRFRARVEESDLKDRFVFVGWAPNEAVPNYYFESDVGINTDRFSYQMLIGCRYRILDMLRAGLPVITTLGTEISEIIRDQRLGLTFPPGDAQALKEAVLTMARDEALRGRCSSRAKEYVFRNRTVERVMAPLRRWAQAPERAPDRIHLAPEAGKARARPALRLRDLARVTAAALAILGFRAWVRRRATAPWGLDPREPPHAALVVRAGSLALTREAVQQTRSRYPAANISVLAPEPLAAETGFETGARVISAPGAGLVSYRVCRATIGVLRQQRFDTAVVAGEGNHRAELLALLSGAARRIAVREDGAAHVLWFAPYKPLLLLAIGIASLLEKTAITVLVGLVWVSIWGEGKVWNLRLRIGALSGRRA
jgi:GT2 family glycosyltransferase/glycosyltransferase involved in cell wall biosynthesis